ncbi:MAG TPA: DUF2089 family protein [Pirellulales bacterium]|jgi:hypothetical protein|nr:DUF2089 family protein [Pirellulales bacterium]
MKTETEAQPPLEQLDDADREFVIRFVLASGSLKDVAEGYGVSYPTIRTRLDRLIKRLEELRRGQPLDPLKELLAGMVAKGEISALAARRVLAVHQKEIQQAQET